MNIRPDKTWEVAHKYDGVIYPGYDCPQTLKDDILNSMIEPGQHVKALGAYVESVCIYDERVVVTLIPDAEDYNERDQPDDIQGEARYMARSRAAADNGGWHHPDCQCNDCYYGPDLAKWAFNPSEY